ncbi:unnamed protein product, partial [Didymodactylos carnosus]
MASNCDAFWLDKEEMYVVKLNRKIPMKHLSLVCLINNELDECLRTRIYDIVNIIELTYGVKYDCDLIQAVLVLLKRHKLEHKIDLFSTENAKELIRGYSENECFITDASLHTIKPFTHVCLSCNQKLIVKFHQKVYVFTNDSVDNGVIYSGHCAGCRIDYYSNSYDKGSKRVVVRQSLHSRKYVYIGGKNVYTTELLLRFASDLAYMYTGFENFCSAYNATIYEILCHRYPNDASKTKGQILLERRLFENAWFIYSTSLFTFLTSKQHELEIPMNISNRNERNSYFDLNFEKWQAQFTLFYTNHINIR